MAARRPPALVDEIVEEILVRVPLDDPARLMRAAAACKRWYRLVRGPGFRRRFREHHGLAPPLLGVVLNFVSEDGARLARFVPTGSFRPRRAERVNWLALDSRHGRVLLRSSSSWGSDVHFDVAVWDPVTDELLRLPVTPWTPKVMYNYKGAVLCAADGCDHLDCRGKPFLVVFLGVVGDKPAAYYLKRDEISSYVYSSEANAWSESARHPYLGNLLQSVRSTFVDNALYFVVNKSPGILKYSLGTREVSAISRPPMNNAHIALMTAEGGGLGCATLTWSELCLWSAEVGLDGDVGWVLGRTIELTRPVPAGPSICGFDVTGFADGSGIVHVETNQGSFIANLKTGDFSELRGVNGSLDILVPYMSFYTPALQVASTDGNLAPEAHSGEGWPRNKKFVEAIRQFKATQDKDAKEKANKSNNKQQ